MKISAFIVATALMTVPVFANSYEYYDNNEYTNTGVNTTRDNYVGFRIHKNENIAFKYHVHGAETTTIRKDNWGFGALIGNKLSNFAKIEFETIYTGAQQNRQNADFDFDVWANMLNFYMYHEYANAIAPYVGLGIGFAAIWGDIDTPYAHLTDSVFDLSYSAMIGVNFALNERVDLNLGIKYQYFGELEHKLHKTEHAITDVDSTEFFFGAAYKFGL